MILKVEKPEKVNKGQNHILLRFRAAAHKFAGGGHWLLRGKMKASFWFSATARKLAGGLLVFEKYS